MRSGLRKAWLLGLLAIAAAVQAQDAPVLFTSDFDDGLTTGWTLGDTAVVVAENGGQALTVTGVQPDGAAAVIGGAWADYTLDLRLKIAQTDPFNQLADVAVLLRADVERQDFTAVFLSTANDRVVIASVLDNQIVATSGASYPLEPDVWYALQAIVVGDQVSVAVDGQPVVQAAVVAEAPSGSAGILAFMRTVALVDDVRLSDAAGAALPDLPVTAAPTVTPPPEVVTNTPVAPTAAATEAVPLTPEPVATGEPPAATPTTGITGSVNVGLTNLRSGPGTDYTIYGPVYEGTVFDVVAQVRRAGEVWYLVEAANGRQAWVWGNNLTLRPSDAQPPEASFIPPAPGV